MKRALSVFATFLGGIFLALAVLYWTTPASSLPAYLPGHDPQLARVHHKHAGAAFVLSMGFLAIPLALRMRVRQAR